MKSMVETLILDRSFDYLQPYFYSNPFALRTNSEPTGFLLFILILEEGFN